MRSKISSKLIFASCVSILSHIDGVICDHGARLSIRHQHSLCADGWKYQFNVKTHTADDAIQPTSGAATVLGFVWPCYRNQHRGQPLLYWVSSGPAVGVVLCSDLFFFQTCTFQLLDKPWSQVSSLLPPGFCLQFLSRIGFSNPTARRFFIECR